jgi:hypothetical protein
LFVCTEGHGKFTNDIFGIAPPSVSEYFYSANNNLSIPLINANYKDNNSGVEQEGNRLYYHRP